VIRTQRIELVAVAVVAAYATQAIIYFPFLQHNLQIGARDIAAILWPVVPALVGGFVATSFLPAWSGGTLVTLACRVWFTACVAALIHGLCTRFRCFKEAGGMISQSLAKVRA